MYIQEHPEHYSINPGIFEPKKKYAKNRVKNGSGYIKKVMIRYRGTVKCIEQPCGKEYGYILDWIFYSKTIPIFDLKKDGYLDQNS